MSRNGAGTYSLPAGNPVVTGTTISSTWANNTLSDIATALTQSLAYDGQTTPTANLPMGGFKHTGIANSAARTHYSSAADVQDGTLVYLTSVAGTDTVTATAAQTMAAYATGQNFHFIAAGTNTGAVTININSIGAKSITKNGTTALVAGDIPSGAAVTIIYDGTRFQIDSIKVDLRTTASTFTADQTLQSTDAGASAGPNLNLDRNSASPAANDVLGAIPFKGRDSGGGTDTYAQVQAEIVDPTAASEDGKLAFQTAVAGTLATRGYTAQGFVIGSPTGGDKGTGTLNATAVYDDNILLGSAASGSSFPLLATKSASASASISFNSADGIGSTYNEYWVQLEHVVPTGSGHSLIVRLDTNDGASFDAGATDYLNAGHGIDSAAASENVTSTGTTSIRISGGTTGLSSTANNGGYNGWVKFKNVNSTAGRKAVRYEGEYFSSGSTHISTHGSGLTNSATLRDAAVNAFQFLMTTDTLASGTFRLFGVKPS